MVNQYDAIALCAQVQGEKVRYFKEYSFKGRIVATEYIPYSEFVRLLDGNAQSQPQAQTTHKNNKIMEV